MITAPADVPEEMRDMYFGCLMWAAGDPNVLAAFVRDTGYRPPQSAIARAIDKATGADDALGREFVEWFNANVWGAWSGPSSN